MKGNFEKRRTSGRWMKYLLTGLLILLAGFGLAGSSSEAAGTYQIRINKQQNCVTIYRMNASGKYKPVKAMVCSAGYATQLGSYSLGEKIRWHTLDGPCYGQYCTRIYGGVLFHSVWYTQMSNPGTLSVYSYNKLGTTASHGCIRLTVADAKWIYDNVPSGTKVIIYNSSNPGPLGKPDSIQIPYSVPWDPTDVWSAGNPWNKKKPSLSGVKNRTVDYNTEYDVMDGVTAKNTTGYDATKRISTKISYQGKRVKKVDTKKPGTYKVVYKVVDEIGRKASATAKIKVTSAKATPKITGVKNLYVKKKAKLKKGFALKSVQVTQGGRKLDKKYIKVTFKKLKKNVYRVVYVAQNASLAAKKTAKVFIDSQAPKITGVKNTETYPVNATTSVNEEYARSLIQVSDNVSNLHKKDVAVTITYEEASARYRVVYSVSDQAGNRRKVTIYLTVSSASAVSVEGAADITVTAAALGCDAAAVSDAIQNALGVYLINNAGVKAYSGSTDITESVQITLTPTQDTQEQIVFSAVYTATDAAGNTASQMVTVTVLRQ